MSSHTRLHDAKRDCEEELARLHTLAQQTETAHKRWEDDVILYRRTLEEDKKRLAKARQLVTSLEELAVSAQERVHSAEVQTRRVSRIQTNVQDLINKARMKLTETNDAIAELS